MDTNNTFTNDQPVDPETGLRPHMMKDLGLRNILKKDEIQSVRRKAIELGMKQHQVDLIDVSFSGSGDSGRIDDPAMFRLQDDHGPLHADMVSHDMDRSHFQYIPSSEDNEQFLLDPIDMASGNRQGTGLCRLAKQFTSAHDDEMEIDWWNNDGGSGSYLFALVVDPDNPKEKTLVIRAYYAQNELTLYERFNGEIE